MGEGIVTLHTEFVDYAGYGCEADVPASVSEASCYAEFGAEDGGVLDGFGEDPGDHRGGRKDEEGGGGFGGGGDVAFEEGRGLEGGEGVSVLRPSVPKPLSSYFSCKYPLQTPPLLHYVRMDHSRLTLVATGAKAHRSQKYTDKTWYSSLTSVVAMTISKITNNAVDTRN